MTTYKSYAECKIAHPDSEIVTTGNNWSGHYSDQKVGTFEKQGSHIIRENAWVICNPADHCSSLEDYFDAGFELVRGDWVIILNGIADKVRSVSAMNGRDFNDGKRYILSVAALNGGCKIPAKAEQWTIYNNTLPLCELTDEQAAPIVDAWRTASNQLECFDGNEWFTLGSDHHITKYGIYRIKLKSERELFIDTAMSVGCLRARDGAKDVYGSLFDSGKFKRVIKDGE